VFYRPSSEGYERIILKRLEKRRLRDDN